MFVGLGSSGFSSGIVAGDLSGSGHTVFDSADEHGGDSFGAFFADDAVQDFGFGFGDFTVGFFNAFDDVGFHQQTFVC